jgi:hypothetical protein
VVNVYSVKNIKGIVLPNVNYMQLIKKYGLVPWLFVFLTKVAAVIFVLWFMEYVLGVHFSNCSTAAFGEELAENKT